MNINSEHEFVWYKVQMTKTRWRYAFLIALLFALLQVYNGWLDYKVFVQQPMMPIPDAIVPTPPSTLSHLVGL